MAAANLDQPAAQIIDIVVRERDRTHPAELDAIDEAGVALFVIDQHVSAAHQSGQPTEVGRVPGRVEHRGLALLEVGQADLKFTMQ